MALFIAVGALKKKKPPIPVSPPDDGEIAQQPTSSSSPSPGSGLDSVFEAFLGNEPPTTYVQPVETVTQETEASLKEEDVNEKETSIEYSEEPVSSIFDDLKASYSQDEEEEEEERVEREEIDWRKAIIYKEILDRKYF